MCIIVKKSIYFVNYVGIIIVVTFTSDASCRAIAKLLIEISNLDLSLEELSDQHFRRFLVFSDLA